MTTPTTDKVNRDFASQLWSFSLESFTIYSSFCYCKHDVCTWVCKGDDIHNKVLTLPFTPQWCNYERFVAFNLPISPEEFSLDADALVPDQSTVVVAEFTVSYFEWILFTQVICHVVSL